jgi:DNA-binding response OmpR family regulator
MTPCQTVFLVEDEAMIRMMVADMLKELGYRIAAEAGEISEALSLAESADFDFAVLDVNLGGHMIVPVADLITARKRPFLFASGYGSPRLPEKYRRYPTLQKPFPIEKLAQVIEITLERART